MAKKTDPKIVGLCAVCVRDIAVVKGLLVHHGYRRPGDGEIHGDCRLVHQAPYELSCEPLKPYLADLQSRRASCYETRRALVAGETRTLRKLISHKPLTFETYSADETDPLRLREWAWLYGHQVRTLETEIASLDGEIGRIQQLIRDWKLAPLREEKRSTASRVVQCGDFVIKRVNDEEWGVYENDQLICRTSQMRGAKRWAEHANLRRRYGDQGGAS